MGASATQVAQFIARIAPIAQAQAKKHGNKIFPSICIAQACNESGFGTSAKMVKANAVFGIKVGKSAWKFGTAWKGKAYKSGTTEYYDGKTATKITDYFRAYDSIEDSVEDYFDLLCTASRYKNALNQPTPQKCIEGIQKAPYATQPKYASIIMSIVKTYNLTKYDSGTVVETAPVEEKSDNPYKVPTETLRRGSMGTGVKWLQTELKKRGHSLTVDGIYGPITEGCVKVYQYDRRLVMDGICGPKTRAELVAGR